MPGEMVEPADVDVGYTEPDAAVAETVHSLWLEVVTLEEVQRPQQRFVLLRRR